MVPSRSRNMALLVFLTVTCGKPQGIRELRIEEDNAIIPEFIAFVQSKIQLPAVQITGDAYPLRDQFVVLRL
jgi:hypothetical protein